MKPSTVLACAAALMALAACNKGEGNAAGNEAVAVTAVAPPPGGDWTEVVKATPAGFMMGNPGAKVKLVEIGALTCPHCRKFDEEGVPALIDKYVKSGQVSWEFRPYLLHGLDVPAVLIAECNGPERFFPLARALYKDQPDWVGKATTAPEAKQQEVQSLPVNQQFAALASLAGLQGWASAHGVPQAKSGQCLASTQRVDQLVQLSNDVPTMFPSFAGTPAFVINGTMLDKTISTWPKLEPELRKAL